MLSSNIKELMLGYVFSQSGFFLPFRLFVCLFVFLIVYCFVSLQSISSTICLQCPSFLFLPILSLRQCVWTMLYYQVNSEMLTPLEIVFIVYLSIVFLLGNYIFKSFLDINLFCLPFCNEVAIAWYGIWTNIHRDKVVRGNSYNLLIDCNLPFFTWLWPYFQTSLFELHENNMP